LPQSSSFFFAVAAVAAPPAARVTTIAGNPTIPGDWDGPAQDAMFTHPTWLDVATPAIPFLPDDLKGGEIFVVDRMNGLIRRISQTGFVSTVRVSIPSYAPPFHLDFDSAFGGGVMVEQSADGCGGGVYSRGVMYASTGTNQLVMLHPSGQLSNRDDWIPILGTGQAGSADATLVNDIAPQFNHPTGIARWRNSEVGNVDLKTKRKVYVADSGNHTIRRISWTLSFEGCAQGRVVTTIAGVPGHPGFADGPGGSALFATPRGIAVGYDGSVYVSDSGNHVIRKIATDGTVTTIAGTPGEAGSDDTHLNTPSGIDVDADGTLYIVDTFNHAIRMLKDGVLTTVAGQLGVSGFADGDGAAAKFNAPVGLKIAPDGTLVIADTGNNVIRRVTLTR
jgi:hypothetical protein